MSNSKKAKTDIDEATKTLRKLMNFAGDEADRLCGDGDTENSARFRRVQAHLTMAYAEGRTICMVDDDGGLIQPFSGGK